MTGAAGALQGQDSRLDLNRLFLSGVLIAEPVKEKGRDGSPVTVLLVAFRDPKASGTEEQSTTTSREVEVPADVAKKHGQLKAGESIFITGQLSGDGGVIASEVHSGPPPDPVAS